MTTTAESAVSELRSADFTARLRAKDPSLWKKEKAHQDIIRNSLGWLTVPDAMAAGLGQIRSLVTDVLKEDFREIVVLGMGGSSLACEVFGSCFTSRKGYPRLSILDSTNPGQVAALAYRLDLKKTLFIASSKSGSTMETNCQLSFFHGKLSRSLGAKTGRHFIAITDPGTSLEKLGRRLGFRKVLLNPTDIGGRYSALSFFGLAPAAIMGVDLETLLNRARAAMRNLEPAVSLGAAMGGWAREGRDKLTLSLSPEIAPFGCWIEQLVAESTGKEGRGILPVLEPLDPGLRYGEDRAFVRLSLKGGTPEPEVEARLKELEKSHPVRRIELADIYDLGAQFFLWEAATAAAGFILGVNPFDQPNVQEAKDQTGKLLTLVKKGALPRETASFHSGKLAAFADKDLLSRLKASRGIHIPLKDTLSAHLSRLGPGDYFSILAYLDDSDENRRLLETLRRRIRERTACPVTVGLGPRYLHSTGQFYKGGGDGVFLILTEPEAARIPVPGRRFSFGTLHKAQARGDFEALAAKRRILRLDLGPTDESLRALVNAVDKLPGASA